jgi:hypothetical protein
MRHSPGEVWLLPPEAEEGGDPKDRRHVLLTTCDDVEDIGIFAYASTQPTEARYGAACVLVDPGASRHVRTGFARPSYVYLSRLVPAGSENLLRMTGRLIDEMPHLRLLLREALGVGKGIASEVESDTGNWRGRVVRLGRSRRESIGYGYAIVVTEPRYSGRQRYQIIVPVEDLREFEPYPGDITVTRGDWFSAIASELPGVLIAVPDIQSVFHPREIDRWTGAVVDDTTMAEIESALIELFEL